MTVSATHPDASFVVATTGNGAVRGLRGDGCSVFRGIRYASAPVGDLRFAPPVPVSQSDATVDATAFGPVSLQNLDPLVPPLPGTENAFYAPGVTASEDCLNLNVWTPGVDGSAPVLVWIHGGAFLHRSGTAPWGDGSRHAREHGILVVSINYRLGLLGGLYLGDYRPEAANLGLQDQLAALAWVRDNIAAFGGDPARVTVAGQSAGAMSVSALIASPASRGLFRRAFVESGHLEGTVPLATARSSTAAVLDWLKIDPEGDVIAELRGMSNFRLAAAKRQFGVLIQAFPLVTDGGFLPVDPPAAIRAGIASDVDLLIGTTSEEDRLFDVSGWAPGGRELDELVLAFVSDPDAQRTARDLYRAESERLDATDLTHLLATEHSWTEPARAFAADHAASGGRTYHYEFGWASTALGGRVGAAHLVDVPFFFGNLDAPGVSDLLGPEIHTDPETIRLAADASDAVAQFVRTGDLTSSALGPWPTFGAGDRITKVIDRRSRNQSGRLADRLDFWASHRDVSMPILSTVGAAR